MDKVHRIPAPAPVNAAAAVTFPTAAAIPINRGACPAGLAAGEVVVTHPGDNVADGVAVQPR